MVWCGVGHEELGHSLCGVVWCGVGHEELGHSLCGVVWCGVVWDMKS